MPQTTSRSVTKTVSKSGGGGPSSSPHNAAAAAPPGSNYVQRGHTVTTVRETERTTTRNKRGDQVVKTKTKTVYYVDGKAVNLNWFDKVRIRFMSTYEKQAFLAEKLLKQERQQRTGAKSSR